ncbi:uncharacterized protein LOC110850168 [Folsomia candida]|uniref:Mite group 2 allergen Pso o 2 n=1 Tax=Folsomia candida TaxID=158441 RepID=A0A226EAC4_FOLCA|nr:uncharacterized protein LOC110850168 [Folsomia candida]OXA54094.1 Mite group 2 allergen Pso o 2 [Folsomia candida]
MSKLLFVFVTVIGSLSALSIDRKPVPAISSSSSQKSLRLLQLNGVGNCGESDLIDVRVAGCTTAPCQIRRGQTITIDVDFRVTGTQEYGNVFFKSLATRENLVQIVDPDVYLQGVRLTPGQQYAFNFDFYIPSDGFTGADSELRFTVYQNMRRPICIIIPATFV